MTITDTSNSRESFGLSWKAWEDRPGLGICEVHGYVRYLKYVHMLMVVATVMSTLTTAHAFAMRVGYILLCLGNKICLLRT